MSLHLHRFGPAGGRPLVALHGLKGYGGRWRRFAEEQLPGYLVLAPDLRGHGLSPTAPPWTLERHAADVLAVLDELVHTRATFPDPDPDDEPPA